MSIEMLSSDFDWDTFWRQHGDASYPPVHGSPSGGISQSSSIGLGKEHLQVDIWSHRQFPLPDDTGPDGGATAAACPPGGNAPADLEFGDETECSSYLIFPPDYPGPIPTFPSHGGSMDGSIDPRSSHLGRPKQPIAMDPTEDPPSPFALSSTADGASPTIKRRRCDDSAEVATKEPSAPCSPMADDDTVRERLRAMGLAFIVSLQGLVCMACDPIEILLATDRNRRGVEWHPKEAHGVAAEPAEVRSLLDQLPVPVRTRREDFTQPRELRPGFPLLPISDGWRCNVPDCNYGSPKRDSVRTHIGRKHPRLSGSGAYIERSSIQSFWQSSGAHYFGVAPDIDVAGPEDAAGPGHLVRQADDRADEFYRQLLGRDTDWARAIGKEPATERSCWQNITRWPSFLEGRPVHDMVKLSRAALSSQENCLRLAMDRLVRDYHDSLHDLQRLHRRILRSAGPEVERKDLNSLQPQTQTRYIKSWVKFVIYCLRVYRRGLLPDYGVVLSDEQAALLGRVDDHLRGSDGGGCGSLDVAPSTHRKRRRGEESQPRDDPRIGHALAPLVALLRELNRAFVMPRCCRNSFEYPLLAYVAVLGVDHELRYREAKEFTPELPPFLYVSRLVVADAFSQRVGREGRLSAEEELAILRRMTADYLQDDNLSPTAEVLSLLAQGRRLAARTVNPPTVIFSGDCTEMSVNGDTFAVADLRSMPVRVLEEVEDLLLKELLLLTDGDDIDGILGRGDLRAVSDDLNNCARGYSFVDDSRNAMRDGWKDILKSLDRPTSHRQRYVTKTDGEPRLRPEFYRHYRNNVHRFLQHLLVLVHTTAGFPARGPEILSTKIRNDQRPRNVFVHDGHVMIVTEYNKSLHQRGSPRTVIRFLPFEVGRVLVLYLAKVERFWRYLERHFHERPSPTSYLWTSLSRPGSTGSGDLAADVAGRWLTTTMTDGLKSSTRKHLDAEIGTGHWRHVAVAIGRQFMRREHDRWSLVAGPDDDDAAGVDVDDDSYDTLASHPEQNPLGHLFDLQTGHTSRTSCTTYGNTVRLLQGLSQESIREFLKVSQSWHAFFDLQSRSPPAAARVPRLLKNEVHTSLGERRRTICFPTFGALLPGSPPSSQGAANDATRGPVLEETLTVADGLWGALMRLYGPDAQFRSEAQAAITKHLTREPEARQRVFVVMPTGAGKTLLILIPALMQRCRRTTVVVAPFVALAADLLERCVAAGIDVAKYRDRDCHLKDHPPSVVIVSAEVAVTPKFRQQLMDWHRSGRLFRVVLDEGHVPVTDTYRERLKDFDLLVKQPLPILFLTATLPPSLIPATCGLYNHLHSATIFRQSTQRPNLAFSVHHIPAKDAAHFHVAFAEQLVKRLRDGSLKPPLIVYAVQVTSIDRIADRLRENDIPCVRYASKNSIPDAAANLKRFVRGEVSVMLATSALGAGVDLRVNTVVHAGPAASFIEYMQQAGRAGRDESRSGQCVHYARRGGARRRDDDDDDELRSWRSAGDLAAYDRFLDSRTTRCRRAVLSEYFDGQVMECAAFRCVPCDLCVERRERLSATIQAPRNRHVNGGPMDVFLQPEAPPLREGRLDRVQSDIQSFLLHTKGHRPSGAAIAPRGNLVVDEVDPKGPDSDDDGLIDMDRLLAKPGPCPAKANSPAPTTSASPHRPTSDTALPSAQAGGGFNGVTRTDPRASDASSRASDPATSRTTTASRDASVPPGSTPAAFDANTSSVDAVPSAADIPSSGTCDDSLTTSQLEEAWALVAQAQRTFQQREAKARAIGKDEALTQQLLDLARALQEERGPRQRLGLPLTQAFRTTPGSDFIRNPSSLSSAPSHPGKILSQAPRTPREGGADPSHAVEVSPSLWSMTQSSDTSTASAVRTPQLPTLPVTPVPSAGGATQQPINAFASPPSTEGHLALRTTKLTSPSAAPTSPSPPAHAPDMIAWQGDLDLWLDYCPGCAWTMGFCPESQHSYFKCLKDSYGLVEWKNYKALFRYNCKSDTGICWFCHLPSAICRSRPPTPPSKCAYEEKLLPLLRTAWADEEGRRMLLHAYPALADVRCDADMARWAMRESGGRVQNIRLRNLFVSFSFLTKVVKAKVPY